MQYTWNGNDGSYTDATNWTPQGVPLYGGDASAVIQSGTVTLSNTEPNNISITLSGPSQDNQPNFVLDNAALGPNVALGMTLPIVNGVLPGASFATITVEGYDTSQATISVGVGRGPGPQAMTIDIAPYSQLNQEGTIQLSLGTLRVDGTGQAPATLNNDGTISVLGSDLFISADVIGNGTIAFLPYPTGSGFIEFGGAVSATQHIAFTSATPGQFRIDDPSAFHGIIDGFQDLPSGNGGSAFYAVTLANTQATGTYFAQITADAGALLVLNGQEVVGALTVTGTHASNSFGFFNNPDGSTTIT